jgi:isochorismate hydrolase
MKKEKYFTNQTIATESAAMLAEVDSCMKRHMVRLKPQSVALLVLDMQDYFLKEHSHAYVPSAQAVLPRIVRLQELFLKKRLRVIHTRHSNDPHNAGMMSRWWRELLTADHPLSGITPELADPRALCIVKSQYDAFHETGLSEILARQGIQQLIITGVLTHLCCETTARSAFIKGFEVFFPVDGSATYNRQFHLASLINLSHGFAVPVLMEEVIAGLENEDAA